MVSVLLACKPVERVSLKDVQKADTDIPLHESFDSELRHSLWYFSSPEQPHLLRGTTLTVMLQNSVPTTFVEVQM